MPDFSSRDFDTIKRDLLARADRVFPEWTDRDPSDFGMLFIDLWAYQADVLHYYIDRAAGESFLATATQRESVLALANLLDYTPRGRSSSTGTAIITNTTTTPYIIAADTEFTARYDNTTFHFYTLYGGTAASAGQVTVDLHEGRLTTDEVLTTTASGSGGQRYTLANDGASVSSLRVNVLENGTDSVPYQRVTRITSAGTGDRVFSTNVTADGAVEVIFGTSLNGFVPPANVSIKATYASSSGAAGNLPANTILPTFSGSPLGVTVASSSAMSGGLDEESITALKSSIPSVISAQNRAVTRNDFVALATQVDGVAKATIAFVAGGVANNSSVTIYPQPPRSDYLTTGDVSQAISTDMQTNVENQIQPLALLGVDVFCAATVDWQPIDVSVTLFVNERYVQNWVKRDVAAAIDDLFSFDNVFFGQRLTLGQLHRLVLNVAGVDYAQVTVFDVAGDTDVENSIVVNELKLPKKGDVVLTMSGGITTS